MEAKKKKELILKTAKDVFSLYGYKKTTVEDIADAMNMTKSNLYFYVKSKQDLYDQVVRIALDEWFGRVSDSLEGVEDLRERFRLLATNAYTYLNEDDKLAKIILKDTSILTYVLHEDKYSDVNMRSCEMIVSIIDEGIEKGVFRDIDSKVTADFFFTLYIMLLRKTFLRHDTEEGTAMFRQALELLMYGLIIPE